jgi:hypothetical protein
VLAGDSAFFTRDEAIEFANSDKQMGELRKLIEGCLAPYWELSYGAVRILPDEDSLKKAIVVASMFDGISRAVLKPHKGKVKNREFRVND